MRRIIYVDNFLTGHGHTPTTGSTLVKLFREEGYTVVQTSSKQNKAMRLADMLNTIIRNRANSVVLIATYSTSAFYFAWACSIVCHWFGVPYVPCLHGGNLPDRIKKSPKLAEQLFGRSATNVAVSGYLQKSMIENGWKSLVIPNNIDIEAYPFQRRQNCSPALLWVRSFHHIYNPTLAIKSFASILKKYPLGKLVMVGPDKDGTLEECKQLANHLGVSDYVNFTGLLSRDQWVKIARQSDIFINTTNFDNLPVSVVEAMALGLVVISTNVGGVPYLIDNELNGFLVPVDNQAALTECIFRVLNSTDLASTLSANARKKAEEFDWKKTRLLWKTLLESV